jgi:outer membrane protein
MNRNRINIALISAFVLFLTSAAVWGQGGKIGFVNSQEVLYGTNEGKEGLSDLDQFMAQQRNGFETRNNELARLQQDLQTKGPTLNADALAKLQRDIQQRQVELQRYQEDAEANFNERQSTLLQAISDKVQQVIEEYAQQNSFLIIFMRDQTQAYVSPNLDVTQEIIRIYNEKFPGKGTATAVPAAATTPAP